MRKTCMPEPTLPKDNGGPSPYEIVWREKCKLLKARLEEARNQNEKYEFTIEKLQKSNKNLQEKVVSIKKDYANMCSKSDEFKLIRENNDLQERLKAKSRVAMNIVQEKSQKEVIMADLEQSQKEVSQAMSTIKDYQVALEQAHRRGDEMAANHRLDMERANHREDRLAA
ncbi:PREDICTED: tropomyosin-like [Lupinus angustifolius]|uniref:tropomyosin-like n=1 Tax=Lupinus angustifolius TaxID=3871 RepID=UPI00092F9C5B|nr:PREDICTED: tropomyosin-like [Lupinus angustifolius]